MRKITFENEIIYHVYNRGFEKSLIFKDSSDYVRFVHDLYVFNDSSPAIPSNIRLHNRNPANTSEHQLKQCLETKTPNMREIIVKILAFCLMPNHFHLMLEQIQENGVRDLMHKLGVGYALYFNEKYERSGHLFQGTYKARLIDSQEYFSWLPYYIHLNPLDLVDDKWRERRVANGAQALDFLNSYRWSSHLDYAGIRNFPSVISQEFLNAIFGGKRDYLKGIMDFLKEIALFDIKKLEY